MKWSWLSFRYLHAGTLPSWASLPPGLDTLILSSNQLSGSVSDGFLTSIPDSLTLLGLDGNELSGECCSRVCAGVHAIEVSTMNVPPSQSCIDSRCLDPLLVGSLPCCSNLTNLNITIVPGNAQLCGEVSPFESRLGANPSCMHATGARFE